MIGWRGVLRMMGACERIGHGLPLLRVGAFSAALLGRALRLGQQTLPAVLGAVQTRAGEGGCWRVSAGAGVRAAGAIAAPAAALW